HLAQLLGNDLPRETELVFEPAALTLLTTARGQLRPKVVDLLLCLAVDEERDRFRELELGPGVQRHEFLALELERAGHQRSRLSGTSLGVPASAEDLRVLEDRCVELHRLFGIVIEP